MTIANNLGVTGRILEPPGTDPKERYIFHISFIHERQCFWFTSGWLKAVLELESPLY